MFATVFFFDGYVQIATCTGGVEIGDLKSTLWNGRLINHVAILPNDDGGVGLCNPTNHRSKAILAGG